MTKNQNAFMLAALRYAKARTEFLDLRRTLHPVRNLCEAEENGRDGHRVDPCWRDDGIIDSAEDWCCNCVEFYDEFHRRNVLAGRMASLARSMLMAYRVMNS